jgi:hypothetical protein
MLASEYERQIEQKNAKEAKNIKCNATEANEGRRRKGKGN